MGWLPRLGLGRGSEIFGLAVCVSCRVLSADGESFSGLPERRNATKYVGSWLVTFSDAGSTPAASTTLFYRWTEAS